MCFYIHIEDLAANALIELLNQDLSKRFVSYMDLEKYGAAVVKILDAQNEKAVLLLSRNSTNVFLHDYSDYFTETTRKGKLGICLREGKTQKDLIQQFRGYLAVDVLLAFMNHDSVATLNSIGG
jgi:hypothetical protein